jgi:dolichol-phosphate mannosyltransferase
VLIVIPTYNEAENIGGLLLNIRNSLPRLDILVVDDNSPDGTAKIVSRLARGNTHIHLIVHPKRTGLSESYKTGFNWALQRNFQCIIQMDGDLSHDPAYLPFLLNALRSHDLAMGTRYLKGGKISGQGRFRRLLSRTANFYARSVLGLPYADSTGRFTAWTRSALEATNYKQITSKAHAFEVELKYQAHKAGLHAKEVPIHFTNRKLGISKLTGNIICESALKLLRLKFHYAGT